MDARTTLHDLVFATLAEMDLASTQESLIRTILLRDGFFVGHKYRFDSGYAVWVAETNVIEVYDDEGKLLKTVPLGSSRGGEAA
jgi:hypothetical protein